MSNIKKIIGVVLALVMALSVATVAFAVENDAAAYTVTISSDKTELAAGESATVTVYLTTNFYASAISIPVFFDNSQVTVSAGSTTIADAAVATETSADSAKLYAGSGYTQADHGVRALVYIAEYGSTIATYNNTAVMTFTVTANEAATGSVTVACSTGSLKTASNTTGALYVAKDEANDDSTMDSLAYNVTNATIEGATATINFASAMVPADLELTAAGAAAGVVIDTNKTFGGQFAGVVSGFTQAAANTFKNKNYILANTQATNGGSLEIKTSDNKTVATGNYGTGTTITVKNSDGSVSKVYVVVIYGDLDGNGLINVNDTNMCNNASSDASIAPNNSYKRMAANCAIVNNATPMHLINIADTNVINNNSSTKINQAALAAQHAKYNTFYK